MTLPFLFSQNFRNGFFTLMATFISDSPRSSQRASSTLPWDRYYATLVGALTWKSLSMEANSSVSIGDFSSSAVGVVVGLFSGVAVFFALLIVLQPPLPRFGQYPEGRLPFEVDTPD